MLAAGDFEDNAVICGRLGADGAESLGNGFGVIVAKTEQIEIAGWPERSGDPCRKEHRAFENETVAMLRNAQPVEEALERVASQQDLKV